MLTLGWDKAKVDGERDIDTRAVSELALTEMAMLWMVIDRVLKSSLTLLCIYITIGIKCI